MSPSANRREILDTLLRHRSALVKGGPWDGIEVVVHGVALSSDGEDELLVRFLEDKARTLWLHLDQLELSDELGQYERVPRRKCDCAVGRTQWSGCRNKKGHW